MKLNFLFSLLVIVHSLSGQDTLLYQNFQDQTFGQFQNIDNDNLDLSADFDGLMGGFNVIPVAGPTDYRAVAVSSFATGGTADNWLISPELEITSTKTILSWIASSLSGDAFFLESYRVMLSTSGSALDEFTTILLEVPAEEMAGKLREIDLSAYEGRTIYLAFNHTGTDNYALTIDNILVAAPSNRNAVKLLKICGERYQDVATPELSLQVVNTGSEVIQDLVVSGSINADGGENTFNDLNIFPLDTAYLPFADLYPFEADRYEIQAMISSVNATAVTGENASGTYFMVADPPSKKLVLEEATSTSCGWCPEGIVQKEFMVSNYGDEIINISIHSDDPMENTLYSLGLENSAGFAGLPSATLNRLNSVSHTDVDAYFSEQFSRVAPAQLEIEYDYNSATRLLTVNLSGVAHTSLNSDSHRFSFIILEDMVGDDSPAFAQANNFSSEALDITLISESGVNWKTLTDPVSAADMVYDDVARDVIGGFDGILESIENAANTESFGHDFEYTLSSAFDENNIWMVAMIIDTETGEVVNAKEEQMLFESSLEKLSQNSLIELFPNPASDAVYMIIEESMEFPVELYNSHGQKIMNVSMRESYGYDDLIRIPTAELEDGLYSVRVNLGGEIVSKKLVVHKGK